MAAYIGHRQELFQQQQTDKCLVVHCSPGRGETPQTRGEVSPRQEPGTLIRAVSQLIHVLDQPLGDGSIRASQVSLLTNRGSSEQAI